MTQNTCSTVSFVLAIEMLIMTLFAMLSATQAMLCRDSWIHDMPYEDFAAYSCSKCFVQVFMNEKNLKIQFPPIYPYLLYGNVSDPSSDFYPDAEEEESLVCAHSLNDDECQMWKDCCQAAKRCCIEETQEGNPGDYSFCPTTWDGISCWKATPGGHKEKQPCPTYYVLDHVTWTSPHVSRQCELGGIWQTHNITMQEYSDYSECFDVSPNLRILRISLIVDFIGNGTSLLFLVIAIIVVLSFRELRVELTQRTGLKLHFSLFISLLCTSTFNIAFHSVYYDAFTSLNPIYEDNAVWCRALHILTKYFKSTTYMCMFCEGLFLYRRISQVMQIGVHESIVKYLLISWVVPCIIIAAYVIVMILTGHNEKCWLDEEGPSNYEFIHMVPNLCSLVCNLVFLISIQYMLCTKMRSDTSDRRIEVLRHAIKATMSLIPIFGLQFLFLIYRPKNWPPYEIIVAVFESTLGALVATLYCFSTREVRTIFRTYLKSCRRNGNRLQLIQPLQASRFMPSLCCKMRCLFRGRQDKTNRTPVDGNVYLEIPNPRRDSAVSKTTQKSFCDGSGSSVNSHVLMELNIAPSSTVSNAQNDVGTTLEVFSYSEGSDTRTHSYSPVSIPAVLVQDFETPQTEPLLETVMG